MISTPSLHIPDEPVDRVQAWLSAVLDGSDLADVLTREDGLVPWLWTRWTVLGQSGVTREDFTLIVLEYRRELWLWLAGERIWTQSCSGLVGRITRRIAQAESAEV
ncbi:MAG: hypothetical protein ACLQRH_26965 [Acidimicrobiales bacterium]